MYKLTGQSDGGILSMGFLFPLPIGVKLTAKISRHMNWKLPVAIFNTMLELTGKAFVLKGQFHLSFMTDKGDPIPGLHTIRENAGVVDQPQYTSVFSVHTHAGDLVLVKTWKRKA